MQMLGLVAPGRAGAVLLVGPTHELPGILSPAQQLPLQSLAFAALTSVFGETTLGWRQEAASWLCQQMLAGQRRAGQQLAMPFIARPSLLHTFI